MSVTKNISLTDRQQLVDLNEDTVNFDLTFTATSKDGSSFEAIVVDQNTLDNNPSLEFKKANGTISGNIISDKNVYQNYFICLKSTKPCDIDIVIDKKEIPPKPVTSRQHMTPPPTSIPPKPVGTNWTVIIIVCVVFGGIALYYMYSNKTTESKNSIKSPVSSPVSSPTPDIPSSSPQPTPPYTNFGFASKKANESLIARLNNLPMK